MLTQDQESVLYRMECNTHTLWAPSFVEQVNAEFGTDIKPFKYKADKHPKGLTLDGGAKQALGMACFDLAPILCSRLGVKYESKMGRGFQVRSCCEAIRKHFNNPMVNKPGSPASEMP